MATSSSDRVMGLTQMSWASLGWSRSTSSAGTVRGWNGDPFGVPAPDRLGELVVPDGGRAQPVPRMVARWSASPGSGRGRPRRRARRRWSVTRANSTAMPQLMTCWRAVGSRTGRARPGRGGRRADPERGEPPRLGVVDRRRPGRGGHHLRPVLLVHRRPSSRGRPGRHPYRMAPGPGTPGRRGRRTRGAVRGRSRPPASPEPAGAPRRCGRSPRRPGRPHRRPRPAPAAPRRAGASPAG